MTLLSTVCLPPCSPPKLSPHMSDDDSPVRVSKQLAQIARQLFVGGHVHVIEASCAVYVTTSPEWRCGEVRAMLKYNRRRGSEFADGVWIFILTPQGWLSQRFRRLRALQRVLVGPREYEGPTLADPDASRQITALLRYFSQL